MASGAGNGLRSEASTIRQAWPLRPGGRSSVRLWRMPWDAPSQKAGALPRALLFLIHLLLGPSRSRPRAGGGWARPLPSGKGWGMGGLHRQPGTIGCKRLPTSTITAFGWPRMTGAIGTTAQSSWKSSAASGSWSIHGRWRLIPRSRSSHIRPSSLRPARLVN